MVGVPCDSEIYSSICQNYRRRENGRQENCNKHQVSLLLCLSSPILSLQFEHLDETTMLKLWKLYQNCLVLHPVKTQVISSGLIWGSGDIAAQFLTPSSINRKKHWQVGASDSGCRNDEDIKANINWRRVAATSLFGFGFVGPVGHFWYERLDRFMTLRLKLPPKSVRFVATKVAIDGLVFGPVDLFLFFTYMGFATGKSADQVKDGLKRDFLPTFLLEGGIWSIVQVSNFRFIPVRYQLLYVNLFCFLDSCFLSWIEQQQESPWKQWFKSFLHL